MNALLTVGRAVSRLGIAPQPSETPDHRLVELVSGPDRITPGRALDLGTGTGRDALYLAANGWDTTGVELDAHQLEKARRRSSVVRWVNGDVTRLSEIDIGNGYTLLMDGGCYHMIPHDRRDAYVDSVSTVAAPGALLIMVGFTKFLGFGMNRDELSKRFTGWAMLAAEPVPGEQMHQSGPRLRTHQTPQQNTHPRRPPNDLHPQVLTIRKRGPLPSSAIRTLTRPGRARLGRRRGHGRCHPRRPDFGPTSAL